MKFITTLLTLIILKVASGQRLNFYQAWIGDSLEYLKLDSTHATFQFSGNYVYHDKKGYHILGDTLRLQDWFHSSSDNYKTLQHKDYDYLISSRKNSILLKPINDNALGLAGNRKEIKYQPINSIYKKSFGFDSLKFTSTTCYGTCPEMTIIIKGKYVFFSGGRHAVKQGNYEAFLTDTLYTKLKDHLRKSAIEKIKNWEQEVYDAPYYTLKVSSKQNQKLIKGYDLPLIMKDLLKFLLELPTKLKLI
ncbi:MAG: hypothetical protein EAZ13_04105 [Sphingobacteriia bacterium]|nr:MAG: hypothetical protein EAZ13_04105 [Sphingobacteriia bacterium]